MPFAASHLTEGLFTSLCTSKIRIFSLRRPNSSSPVPSPPFSLSLSSCATLARTPSSSFRSLKASASMYRSASSYAGRTPGATGGFHLRGLESEMGARRRRGGRRRRPFVSVLGLALELAASSRDSAGSEELGAEGDDEGEAGFAFGCACVCDGGGGGAAEAEGEASAVLSNLNSNGARRWVRARAASIFATCVFLVFLLDANERFKAGRKVAWW